MKVNRILKKILISILIINFVSISLFSLKVIADTTIPTGSTGNITYEAIFAYEEYSIEYDLAGGNIPSGNNPTKYTIKTPRFELINPVREGYEFLGWSGGYEGDIEEIDGDHYIDDTEYILNPELGSDDPNIPYKKQIILNKGVTVTTTDAELETIDYKLISAGNRKYTAHWKKNLCSVVFYMNGHGTAPETQDVEVNNVAIKPNDPTDESWTFDGWYKEESCQTAYDFSQPITDNTIIYAKWIKDVTEAKQGKGGNGVHLLLTTQDGEYNVFALEGGEGAVIDNECTEHPLPDNFKHLKEAIKGGGETDIKSEVKDTQGNTIFKKIMDIEELASSDKEEANLTKELIPAVRYDTNGGKGRIEDLLFVDNNGNIVSKIISSNKDLLGNPIIVKGVKYEFNGWNTKWDGTGKQFAPGEEVTAQTIKEESQKQGRNILHLYAIWTKETNVHTNY